ncbi:MAG: glycosyltransferase [Deltaproteobacteria bacterium]|nr:glycosyltransferase [Deltaproteobacteria bacterium]
MTKEGIYQEILEHVQGKVTPLKGNEIVIGIPFVGTSDQMETLPKVIEVANEGIKEFYPGKKIAFVLAGSYEGKRIVKKIKGILKEQNIKGFCFTLDKEADGKGWAFRVLMEVSEFLDSDLILLESDFLRKGKQGIQPTWIYSIYRPIELGNDFVLPVFNRPPEGKRVTDHLVVPLLVSLYGYRLKEPIGGVYGISRKVFDKFLKDKKLFAQTDVGNYGIDIFLTITAIVNDLKICQANLGTRLKPPSPGEFPIRLRQVLNIMFDQIEYSSSWWLKEGKVLKTEPPFYGDLPSLEPPKMKLNVSYEIERFKIDFQRYKDYLYKKLCHPSLYQKLLGLSNKDEETFYFSSSVWAECVYILILAYFFQREIPKVDILDTLVILDRARLATFFKEVQNLEGDAKRLESDRLREAQIKDFTRLRESFEEHWREKKLIYVAPVERVLLEFLPGVPLNLPKEVKDSKGRVIRVFEVYEDVMQELQRKGIKFLPQEEKIEFMQRCMDEIDEKLREVLQGTIYSVNGVRKLVEYIFKYLPSSRGKCFFLNQTKIIEFLEENIPYNLFGVFGYKDLDSALKKYEPRDILILASSLEGKEFNERFWDWFKDAQPDWFGFQEKGFIVQDNKNFAQWVHSRGEPSDIETLCGKILVTQYPKAAGLEYPYVLYLSLIVKLNIEMEMSSEDWQFYSKDRDFSEKVMNSLRRHRSRDALSAHEIFEANVDEVSMERIRKSKALSGILDGLLEVYHVIYRLDGDFLSLGFPSWAIYRTWGRKGLPSKGFLGEKTKVEQRWFVRELILKLAEIEGLGDKNYVDRKLREMRGNGIEDKNIAVELGLLPPLRFDKENLPLIFKALQESADRNTLMKKMNPLIKSFSRKPTLDDLTRKVPKELKPTEEQIEEVYRLAHELKGLEITHVNSARYGGGVAEILDWLVPVMNSVGIKANWVVIRPKNSSEFFRVTKTFHNALQGMEATLTKEMKDIYLRESAYMFEKLSREGKVKGDILVCHDPQPLAAITYADKKKVWRAHTDLSFPQRAFVDFLLPFIAQCDASIFHFEDFILEELKGKMPTYLIPAGINFLTPKNIELPPEFCSYVLKSFGINKNKPIILQISRFDRFKDPKGVVEAFESARSELLKEGLDMQLVYAGNMAVDDPEGLKILSELINNLGAKKKTLHKRKFIPNSVVWTVGEAPSIFIINLEATPVIENALVVNALQRGATIILQKSLKEGLGLTILEAMCKRKPLIVGNIGGPAHLIKEDGLYGYGVGDKDEKGNVVYTSEETAGKILKCFEAPQEALEMSERAQRNAGVNYSAIRHLLDYLRLFHDIMNPPNSIRGSKGLG